MALLTAAQAREAIPSLGSAEETTTLDTLVADCGAAFARRCGYPPATVGATPTMESTSYTINHDGRGGRDLTLEVWPATAVASVRDDPTLDFTDSAYLLTASDYAIVDGSILRLSSTATWGAWGRGKGRIRVAFTAGWAAVPADLARLAKMAVRHFWDTRGKQTRKNVGMAGDSIAYSDDAFLPDFVVAGLGAFFLPSVMG